MFIYIYVYIYIFRIYIYREREREKERESERERNRERARERERERERRNKLHVLLLTRACERCFPQIHPTAPGLFSGDPFTASKDINRDPELRFGAEPDDMGNIQPLQL